MRWLGSAPARPAFLWQPAHHAVHALVLERLKVALQRHEPRPSLAWTKVMPELVPDFAGLTFDSELHEFEHSEKLESGNSPGVAVLDLSATAPPLGAGEGGTRRLCFEGHDSLLAQPALAPDAIGFGIPLEQEFGRKPMHGRLFSQ